MAKDMNQKTHLPKVLPYLREYAKGISIAMIDESWLDGFRTYLLAAPEHPKPGERSKGQALGKSTAGHYFPAVCSVLKKAHRDRVIPRNPAENVKKIPVPEPNKIFLNAEELEVLARTPLGGELGGEILYAVRRLRLLKGRKRPRTW